MRGVKIAVKADDSKEHSKVAPRSPLISSLPRLVPPPCYRSCSRVKMEGLHPTSEGVTNTISGVVGPPRGPSCPAGSQLWAVPVRPADALAAAKRVAVLGCCKLSRASNLSAASKPFCYYFEWCPPDLPCNLFSWLWQAAD